METEQISIQEYLVRRGKKGDREAQGELYRMYVNAMYNTARRILGNEEEARDVVQDTFIHAFSKLNTLKNEITFGAWLKRITINNSINAIKKRRNVNEEWNERMELPEEVDEPEYSQEDTRKVMEAIDHISEGCRTVLNLYVFEGYDHKEISQILNISESASKAQYSKAKSKIRKLLERE